MKKIIKECNGYKIKNPVLKKENLKYKFMEFLFLKYIGTSIPDIQEENDNSAHSEVNFRGKCETPYFNLEFLHLFELIPKEQLNVVLEGIFKFGSREGDSNFLYNCDKSYDYFEDYAPSSIEPVLIKKNSKLFPYVYKINFNLINVTESFLCLDVMITVNCDLKKCISDFIISNVKYKTSVTGFEGKRWFEFKKLQKTTCLGHIIKRKLLDEFIVDIKCKVASQLKKYIPIMILNSYKSIPPSVSCFKTNIDENICPEFWNSVGVETDLCDYLKDYSGRISCESNDSNIKYIYNGTIYSDNKAIYINSYLYYYLIINSVNKIIRKKLVEFSKNTYSISKKNIKYLLELKINIDLELFYYIRFINEYDSNDKECMEFVSLDKKKQPMIEKYYKEMNRHTDNTKKLYDDIMKLYQLSADYRNARKNYEIENDALIVAIMSLIVAIMALIK